MKPLIIDEVEFTRLYQEEMLSHKEIAIKLGCSRSFVTSHVIKLGLTRDRTAIAQEHRRQSNIRTNRLKYKGDDWPRTAGKFKFMFPTDKCGWIRCPNPTAPSSKWDVDHNHNCTRHEIVSNYRHYANGSIACKYCVRAYVHHSCNVIIEHWEWAQKEGLPIPNDVAAFLSIGA
jgi:predicted DNA-binding protein (UPF0251 family)